MGVPGICVYYCTTTHLSTKFMRVLCILLVVFCQNYRNMLWRMVACDGCGLLLRKNLSPSLWRLGLGDGAGITDDEFLSIFVGS